MVFFYTRGRFVILSSPLGRTRPLEYLARLGGEAHRELSVPHEELLVFECQGYSRGLASGLISKWLKNVFGYVLKKLEVGVKKAGGAAEKERTARWYRSKVCVRGFLITEINSLLDKFCFKREARRSREWWEGQKLLGLKEKIRHKNKENVFKKKTES